MNNFIVTIFVNNKMCQYKIDELIQNSFNGYVDKSFVFGNKKIYLPIHIQAEYYTLQSKSSAVKIYSAGQEAEGSLQISHGDYLTFDNDGVVYSALFVDCSTLSMSSNIYMLGEENVFIGRSEESNIIIDINANVSRKCAAIHKENDAYVLEDLSTKTPIYVNGKRESSRKLENGDEIYLMGTTMVYFDGALVLPSNIRTNALSLLQEYEIASPEKDEEESDYVRTPRIIKSVDKDKIVIDAPTPPQKSKQPPFLLTAGPSITMSLAMLASVGITIANAVKGNGIASVITSSVMAVSMLAGALLWPVLLRRYNKKQERLNEEYRIKRYELYLAEKEGEIKEKHERNARVLKESAMPSPADTSKFIFDRNRRLWERVPTDEDFLLVRLGVGEIDTPLNIQAPEKAFTLEDDPMVEQALDLKNRYETLTDVPIAISLADKRVIGVVGDTKEVFKVIVSNIVALHSPDEVKIALIYNSSDLSSLKWANDLPHTWSNDRKRRYVATTPQEARALLAHLDEVVSDRETSQEGNEDMLPRYVVLVLDDNLIEDLPFRKRLIDKDNTSGISTVFFGKRFSNIPKECVAIIQKDAEVCGMYVKNENNNRFIKYKSDSVSDSLMKQLCSEINQIPVKIDKTTEAIPDRVTFLDMFRVGNVGALEITNHWGTNVSERSLAAPIGVKAGGEIFSLDIHEKYHGCHGLVAGTTGSGKSEFLQAYILSMMINYSPNEVAFVLVDFKGGDMARPFLRSPHLAATISNLSGNTLHRALISLEAEVKSRQSLFNKSAEILGVDKIDINSYHKYFKDKKLDQPLPHLIIVIDEFAQLKSQHPEFMSKLIDIAQVGRSLGIHLILATQRPSGVVDPQIWSNSKFKVCLKVLDKQDSMDMLGKPEAALIKQPGRAFVQVGYDEIFEQIQSGYSGADYIEQKEYIDEDSVSVDMVNWHAERIRTSKKSVADKKSERTQLEETVSLLASIGEQQKLRAKKLWLPPLSTSLLLERCLNSALALNIDEWDTDTQMQAICGMVDLPEKQKQEQYSVDFLENGHLAIYGASGTGKSTLIQTILFSLALKLSPEMLNLFVADFGGGGLASLASMPHCSRYVSDSDDAGLNEMLDILNGIIAERREIFTKSHCANYESYIRLTDEKMPMIIFALDDYAAFREKTHRVEDTLVQLVSAARACGIYFIVTGNSKGAIYYRVTEHISERIVLNMNDSGAYRDILNVSVPIMPEQAKGRGLVVKGGKATEVQFAVPFNASNESLRASKINEIYAEMAKVSKGNSYSSKRKIKSSTEKNAPIKDISSLIPTAQKIECKRYKYAPSDEGDMLVGVDKASGEEVGFNYSSAKRIFIGTRASSGLAKKLKASIVRQGKKAYIISSNRDEELSQLEFVDDIDAFVDDLWAKEESDLTDIIIVIDGFCDFFDRISDEALNKFEKIVSRSPRLHIVTLDDMQRWGEYQSAGLYSMLVRAQCGVIIGGEINNSVAQAITTDIYSVPTKSREIKLDDGEAIVYSKDEIAYVKI
ncbi:MAG: type VII secretion protein EssC [Clostridia bacterium]|nr:type VII secretion protein EssC [Clostridia bacterium]